MKTTITSGYTFVPGAAGAGTLSIVPPDGSTFDFSKVYAIINDTSGVPVYLKATAGFGATAVVGNSITLQATTVGQNAADKLSIIYDAVSKDVNTQSALASSASPSSVVQPRPMNQIRTGFSNALATTWDAAFWNTVKLGTGMGLSQSASNGVITTGTTVNAETILRSLQSFSGPFCMRYLLQLSQRIANNNFYVELVDVVGDLLPYTINSTTSVTVDFTTAPGGMPFTAQHVGQSMYLGALSSVGVPGRYVLASVAGNTGTFTVAGFPGAGSGTCSVFGRNYHHILYNGITATAALYDAQRSGYASGDSTITINTAAAPGHIGILAHDNWQTSFSDTSITGSSTAGTIPTVRTARQQNQPAEDIALYLQVRAVNGTVAPATTTTLQIGFINIDDYNAQNVSISSVRPQDNQFSMPVTLMGSTATAVQGGNGTSSNSWYVCAAPTMFADTVTPLGASATFTGTARDDGATASLRRFTASSFADVAGTLQVWMSTDNITFRLQKEVAAVAVSGGFGAELDVSIMTRYHQVRYVNGAAAQSILMINSAQQRI